MNKNLIRLLLLSISVFGLTCCGVDNNGGGNNNPPDENEGNTPGGEEEKEATYIKVKPIRYQTINTQTDMNAFYAQTKQSNGSSWDNPLDYGFVPSVWHTLKINDVTVPVYSTRCGFGIHSFAYVDIDTDGTFSLNTEVILLDGDYKSAIILPEKANVSVNVASNKYSFDLKNFGDYTLCFGSTTKIGPEKAITIYIAKETKDVVPEGYNQVNVEPGRYDDDSSTDTPSLRFTGVHTYYRFKKGYYDINSILIPNDSIVYFEPGTYIEARQDNTNSVFENGGTSMKILGRCLVDFSKLMGGDAKTKGAYNFNNLSDGAYVEGFVSINSNTWTMCFTNCDNLEVANNMLFGYRTYSDGIMLSGCQNAYVHHNFVRTGDDAIEAKATSSRKLEKNELLYEYNTVWTDKAKAYGCIYESNANITGVKFRHNSIGFAQANWHQTVGCLVIQLGSDYGAVWSNVLFEDIEVYCSTNTIMNILNSAANFYNSSDPAAERYGGMIKDIYFKNIRVKRLETTNFPAYMFQIIYIVADGYPEYVDHLKLGKIYIDNCYFNGTMMEKDNMSSFTYIELPTDFIWSMNNLKWNTNPTINF